MAKELEVRGCGMRLALKLLIRRVYLTVNVDRPGLETYARAGSK